MFRSFLPFLAAFAVLTALLGCSSTMPTGVGQFPKSLDVVAGKYRLCDRSDTASTNCTDVTNYTVAQRNLMQHTLLAIATDRCHDFKNTLYSWTRVGIFSGGASHLLSAVAAVLPHKPTSRAVAGGGAVSAAVGGDIDAYFRESKLAVAVAGIELARTSIFYQIKEKYAADLKNYPVSRAFNDALRYHGVCNLADGLDAAGGAVEDATERAAKGDNDQPPATSNTGTQNPPQPPPDSS